MSTPQTPENTQKDFFDQKSFAPLKLERHSSVPEAVTEDCWDEFDDAPKRLFAVTWEEMTRIRKARAYVAVARKRYRPQVKELGDRLSDLEVDNIIKSPDNCELNRGDNLS